jgi:hypothetical protein
MGFHQKQWISCQSNEGFNHPTFGAVQLKSMEFFTNKTGDSTDQYSNSTGQNWG